MTSQEKCDIHFSTGLGPQPVDSREVDVLIKDYELKIGYLTEHFSRMWTRFNFEIISKFQVSACAF